MAGPQTATAEIDFTQPPPAAIDFTQPPPAAATPPHDQFAEDRAVTDAWAQDHPILGPIARFLVAGGQNAANAITDTPKQLYHAIVDPVAPEEAGLTTEQRLAFRLGGKQAIEAGDDYISGKVTPKAAASVLPEALGTGVGQVSGGAVYGKGADIAAEALPKVIEAAGDISKTKATAPVRAAVRGANKVLAKAPGTVGGAAGATVGGYVGGHIGAEIGGAAGAMAGREILPQVRIPGEGFGLPSRVRGGPGTAPKFTPPAAEAAAASAAEDLEGVTSPQTEAAGELAEESAPEATPQNAAAARKLDTSPKAVQQQLEDALGGKKLVPGVSLKNQITAQGAAAGALPEGFTPVESSALKGYKYDPAAREFEYVTKDGSHYVRGDVDPEAAAQFEKTAEDTGSFGKAWHELRNNPQGGVGQFKVLNGKRVPVVKTGPITDLAQQIKDSAEPSQAPTGKTLGNLPQAIKKSVKARSVVVDPATGRPEFSDVLEAKQPATGAPEEDLTDQLTKSVEQAKAKKAAPASTVEEIPDNVMTMRDPGELAKRWGVDAQSLAEGREQTRGMSPAETEAQIKQLTARYKKGFAVEPVMETRDAENNLIEVDGRARAIAAQRAGVKKVPIIVRRLATK